MRYSGEHQDINNNDVYCATYHEDIGGEKALWIAVAEGILLDYIVASTDYHPGSGTIKDNMEYRILHDCCFKDTDEPGTLYWIVSNCLGEDWEITLQAIREWLIKTKNQSMIDFAAQGHQRASSVPQRLTALGNLSILQFYQKGLHLRPRSKRVRRNGF